jgi:hypothetical protein
MKANWTLRLAKATEETCLLCNGALDAGKCAFKLDATVKIRLPVVGFTPMPLSGEIHPECAKTFHDRIGGLLAEAKK